MKNIRLLIVLTFLLLFQYCTVEVSEENKSNPTAVQGIEGTWKLTSAIKVIQNDTTYTDYTKDMDGIKIIGSSHFAFFQHDLRKGQDSTKARFSSGSGKYVLQGNRYTEFLEYCSAREWEGNKFSFDIKVQNDTLTQSGVEKIEKLGVNRYITEIYVRTNDYNSPIPVLSDFDVNTDEWLENSGNGTIKGTAKFKSQSGEIRFGDSFGIELMPTSPYTEERLSKIYGNEESGHVSLSDGIFRFIPDPSGYHATRKTTCDKNGAFEFKNLPSGTYYIVAFMIWEDDSNSAGGKLGGGIMQRIELGQNEKQTIDMSNF